MRNCDLGIPSEWARPCINVFKMTVQLIIFLFAVVLRLAESYSYKQENKIYAQEKYMFNMVQSTLAYVDGQCQSNSNINNIDYNYH